MNKIPSPEQICRILDIPNIVRNQKDESGKHGSIIGYFKVLANEANADYQKEINKLEKKMRDLNFSQIINKLNNLVRDFRSSKDSFLISILPELKKLYEEIKLRKQNVKSFATKNAIKNRDPDPIVSNFSVAFWILLIALMEVMFNAKFFSTSSSQGLFGGAIQAVVISVINIILAFLLGRFCYPQLNHSQPSNKRIGKVLSFLILVCSLAFQFLAGHYRSALDMQNTSDAFWLALQTIKENFFAIKSVQGWWLFAVGIGSFILFAIKFYNSDDPYPGYGKVFRIQYEAEENLTRYREKSVNIFKKKYESIQQDAEDQKKELIKFNQEYKELLNEIEKLKGTYKTMLSKLRKVHGQVLTCYREEKRIQTGSAEILANTITEFGIDAKALPLNLAAVEQCEQDVKEVLERALKSSLIEEGLETIFEEAMDKIERESNGAPSVASNEDKGEKSEC